MTERILAGPAAAGRRASGPSSRPARWTAVVVAVVLGIAVGRFVTYDHDDTTTALPAVVAGRVAGGSLEQLEATVERDADNGPAWQALGLAYVRRAAESGDPSFYDLADRALGRADRLLPGDPVTTVGRGNLALARHRFPDALRLGRAALAADAFDRRALAVVVDAEVELGRYAAAERDLERLLDLGPDLPALARASYLQELHGDVDAAIQTMQQAESAGAGSAFDVATVVALLGDIHFGAGDLGAAGRDYERALALSPRLALADIGRARVLASQRRDDDAVAILRTVVDRAPQPAAAILLGDVLQRAGQHEEAADTFELVRAMAQLQADSGAVVDLEMALFEADHGDPSEGVRLARRARAARPTIYADDALAWSLYREGDARAAVPFAQRALRLGTRDGLLRYHAAAIFSAAGRADQARAELTLAFESNPWFSLAHEDDARQLAARLGVAVPAELSGR